MHKKLLDSVQSPADLKRMNDRELSVLAREVRNEVIETVSQTGGHLGSSLGVVELTVAIHAIFNTPFDKLVWDVGHQCYPHKILTGRRHHMKTLRQTDGISGFTKRSESEYDPFGAAHSSTSISAALGFALARKHGQSTGDAIAVIGDGSISAGMAYEALNNAGSEKERLFVILNDNEMSIAPPVGAMSSYLSRVNQNDVFGKLKEIGESLDDHLPFKLRDHARRAKQLVTGTMGQATLFEELGFDYIGPIDGHDMDQLLSTLRSAKARANGPVLIHICTKKGYGYAPAENSADKYHGVSKFDVSTGVQKKTPANSPSYTSVFGKSLLAEASQDPRVVAVTAAMPSGTGVDILAKEYPRRVYDVGIAEQHAVTFAAGLAATGMRPFCAIYSTFLQRAYDQIVHDVALQNLPVRFAIDRAGLVGADGPTHGGVFDISYMANIPNMTVMAASDEAELAHMVRTAAEFDDGPICFRYPRGTGPGVSVPTRGDLIEIGKGRIVKRGSDLAILSFGAHLDVAREAAQLLEQQGVSVTIADARFAKPLDTELVDQLVASHVGIVTLEQGAMGGFGAIVLQHLTLTGQLVHGVNIDTLFLPDRFIDQGSPDDMYQDAELSLSHVFHRSMNLLQRTKSDAVNYSAQCVNKY